jgi:hypothetical protein
MALFVKHDFEAIFDIISHNDSFEDWPFPLIYQQVFHRFGDEMKYVLTTRKNPETWLGSLKKHSLLTHPDNHYRMLAYGYNYPHGYENQHIEIYNRHIAEAIDFFGKNNAPGSLLILNWEMGDGWEKLCQFVNRPVPGVPFPHENNSSRLLPTGFEMENQKRINQQIRLLMNPDSDGGECVSRA